MITKHEAIYKLYPNVVTIRDGVAYDMNNNIVDYDDELVTTEFESNQYASLRTNQYPSIGDQLDMLWHAIDSGTLNKTSDFYTTLKAVKDAYPKAE
jgi:hypothetical protein